MPRNIEELSLSAAEQVDSICDRFESAWKAGTPLRIEDLLTQVTDAGNSGLLGALLAVELELRQQSGDRPSADPYVARFPDRADSIALVFNQAGRARQSSSLCAQDTIPLAPASAVNPQLTPGSKLGRFEVLEVLGSGAFGTVYLARDPHLDRKVAIKVPRSGVAEPAQMERFMREARAMAGVRHPNICPVYEVGADAASSFIVMAYVAGQTLDVWLAERAGPLSSHEAAQLTRQIALGLEAAHSQGVIHRDLKPSNILLDHARGEAVVTDFGLARRITADDPHLTRDGTIVGTAAYMSPEQARGDLDAIGPKSDVYSLGVILYQMLAGRPPFVGRLGEVVGKVQHVEPEAPSRVRGDVDPRLEQICLRALAKNPNGRFPSMSAFADALGEFLQTGRQATVASLPSAESPREARQFKKRPMALAVVVGAVILLAGSIALYVKNQRTSNLDDRVRELDSVLGDPKQGEKRTKAIVAEPEAAPKPPTGWQVYRNDAGGYSIWLPGKPKESQNVVATKQGDRPMNQIQLADTTSGLTFMVTSTDFADRIFPSADEALDAARNGAVEKANAKLLSETRIMLGEHPGREFRIAPPIAKGLLLRARIYLVGQRSYMLLVAGPEKAVEGRSAETFLTSFRLSREF